MVPPWFCQMSSGLLANRPRLRGRCSAGPNGTAAQARGGVELGGRAA
eukprot:SAG22_NODE_21927_length_252_cov_39.666667_1_plen_46_part_01